MPKRYLIAALLAVSNGVHAASCVPAQSWDYHSRGQVPHNPRAFTQGLVFSDGRLAESSGLYGQSSLMLHHPAGLESLNLPKRLFAEGLAWYDNQLWQLSWKAGELRVYSTEPLRLDRRMSYQGEGWGLTHDGQRFIMSNGSARLQFRNSEDFRKTGERLVRDGQRPVELLNELEWVAPWVLANVWQQDRIAVIDPRSGCVHAWLDLQTLWPKMIRPRTADVLNGIAWNPKSQELWVTGKRWPKLYRLHVEPLVKPRKSELQ